MRLMRMEYVISALLESVGVMLLATAGWCFALRLARWRFWWAGLVFPVAVLILLICDRMAAVPFAGWFLAGRVEFVVLALAIPLLLIPLAAHLPVVRQRRLVHWVTLLLTLRFAVLPFLAPAFEVPRQSALLTFIGEDGICIQGTGYNCGPAAAVTVLKRLGVTAEEGALALSARTTCFIGTPADFLVAAIEKRHGISCRFFRNLSLEDVRGSEPFIAVVKHALMTDHYVVVLEIGDDFIWIGDPLSGRKEWTLAYFQARWRKSAILF